MVLQVNNNNGSVCCQRDVKIITNVPKGTSYIKYTLSGVCSPEEVVKLPKEIYALCQKKNIWRVFLDTKSIHELNINTFYQFDSGESLAKVLNNSVRLAVYGEGEIFTDFTEIVAVNRGAHIKVSNDYATLKLWLTND